MAILTFEDLGFEDQGKDVRVTFYRLFSFTVAKSSLSRIGQFTLDSHTITFDGVSEEKARNGFNAILDEGFLHMTNKLNGRKFVYVHRNLGIPLIGLGFMGIVHRNSSIIEVKPITGCNLTCNYCSISEGKNKDYGYDFVIEPEFLKDELFKLLDEINYDDMEIHLNAWGEPSLYSKLVEFIGMISKHPQIKRISIDTNGMMLHKKFIDELYEAGLTSINLSLNAMDQELANKIAGTFYNLKRVKKMAKYAASKGILLIAPTYIPGINDSEMVPLALFAKELGVRIGIQNFLPYKTGRMPVKSVAWEKFYALLEEWQNETGVKLIMSAEDFSVVTLPPLKKPFKKKDVVDVDLLFPARKEEDMIGHAQGRLVMLPKCSKRSGRVKVKITSDKHNIFYGGVV